MNIEEVQHQIIEKKAKTNKPNEKRNETEKKKRQRKAFTPSNGICRESRHIDASNCIFCLKTMLTRRAERIKARIENDNNKNNQDKDHTVDRLGGN